jgi:hypothetical protein
MEYEAPKDAWYRCNTCASQWTIKHSGVEGLHAPVVKATLVGERKEPFFCNEIRDYWIFKCPEGHETKISKHEHWYYQYQRSKEQGKEYQDRVTPL